MIEGQGPRTCKVAGRELLESIARAEAIFDDEQLDAGRDAELERFLVTAYPTRYTQDQ
jgi:hypothetical protein